MATFWATFYFANEFYIFARISNFKTLSIRGILGTTTLSITTFGIMTLSISGLYVTLSTTMLCHYAESDYTECHYVSVVAPYF
jgi:hypothetical protein